eukprot:scaffold44307_cov69-Phaeocystis_antarctica.AAC.1
MTSLSAARIVSTSCGGTGQASCCPGTIASSISRRTVLTSALICWMRWLRRSMLSPLAAPLSSSHRTHGRWRAALAHDAAPGSGWGSSEQTLTKKNMAEYSLNVGKP